MREVIQVIFRKYDPQLIGKYYCKVNSSRQEGLIKIDRLGFGFKPDTSKQREKFRAGNWKQSPGVAAE